MTSSGFWATLERWRISMFLLGGVLLLVDAAWLAGNLATGGENYLITGQFFVATGWTAALLGVLGIYPSLTDESRWLSGGAAVCTAVGVATFAVMGVVVSAELLGILPVAYESVGSVFIPGVLLGSVVGIVLFGLAVLRTDVFAQTFGLLLFVPPVLVLGNIVRFALGNTSEMVTLGIVIGDALAILVLGYYLRTRSSNVSRHARTDSAV